MSNEERGWDESLGDLVSPGDVVAGKFRVDRLIGTGGMGIVVEAFHLHFEERVAIKSLVPQMGANEEALTRFEREAKAAFKIKSEHVTRVIDVGKLDGKVPYMVMEFLQGTDLGVMLTDRKAFPLEDAVEYVLQAIEAVAEAHVLGIVHRDLKPENLFLTHRADGTPCVKVLDFGLSKALGREEPPERRQRALTGTSQVMGTPQYMSPEQWMSARDVGPATDQWALGVILYELVTGLQPFDQEQLAQLCTQVLRGEPTPLAQLRPEAPAGLEQVILRSMRKEPRARYTNVGEMALALLPFGPARARTSAKRIAGVFKRVGVDTGDVPPSVRGGGLGHNMVLGRIPTLQPDVHSSKPTIPNVSSPVAAARAVAVAAAADAADAAAAAAPIATPVASPPLAGPLLAGPPLGGPPVATPISMTRTAAMGVVDEPPAGALEDLAATQLYANTATPRAPAEASPYANLPPPSSPTASPLSGVPSAPVSKTALMPAYGPGGPGSVGSPAVHASRGVAGPPPSAPWGAMHTPGPHPSGPASQPHGHSGASASGQFVAPHIYPPPGSQPDPYGRPRRAITAQSWQNMLNPTTSSSAADKRVVFAVAAVVIVSAALAIFLLVSGSQASPGATGNEGIVPRDDDARDDDGSRSLHDPAPAASTPEEPDETPAASGAPADSTKPASSSRTGSGQSQPSGSRPTQPKGSNPFRKGSIFDNR